MLKKISEWILAWINKEPKTFLIIKFIGLYGSLRAIYHFMLVPNHEVMNHFLGLYTSIVTKIAHDILKLPIEAIKLEQGIGLWFDEYLMLVVDATCSAGVIYILFISLMLLFRKFHRQMIPYLLVGILGIFIINTLRIGVVTYVLKFHTVYFDLFHNYLFLYFIYLFVFYIWYKWYKAYNRLMS